MLFVGSGRLEAVHITLGYLQRGSASFGCLSRPWDVSHCKDKQVAVWRAPLRFTWLHLSRPSHVSSPVSVTLLELVSGLAGQLVGIDASSGSSGA